MIHLLLFLAMGVGLQTSAPISKGIQQTDTHGPCVGDSCGHFYGYMHLHGTKPKHRKITPHDKHDESLPKWNGTGDYCTGCYFTDYSFHVDEDAGKIVSGGDPGLTVPPCADTPRDRFSPCSLTTGSNVTTGSREPEIYHLGIPDNISSSIEGNDGSKVVSLSDKEYNHLQEIRQAVGDEEKRLAVKYGADPGSPFTLCPPNVTCMNIGNIPRPADHFEFHGRFLIIDKGNK